MSLMQGLDHSWFPVNFVKIFITIFLKGEPWENASKKPLIIT